MADQLLSLDRALFFAINNDWAGPTNDILIGWATWLGNGLVLAVVVIPLLYFVDRKNFARNLALIITAVIISAIAGEFLKRFINRPRPLKDMADLIEAGKIHIHVLFGPLRERSMPSGHTVLIFTVASSLSLLFHKYAVPFFVVAMLTGVSRIYVGAHYPSDVLAGALIGILSTVLVYWFHQGWFGVHEDS
jgi:undecaprenyl-diphosphatase